MKQNRNYSCKDIDMLIVSQTITQNFKDNITELSAVRTNWTPEYAEALKEKISSAMENYLGLDKKKELRQASEKLAQVQGPALRDLSFLLTQIEVDFEEQASDIKKNLGFSQHFTHARKGDQESLIQLLFAFNKGLTDELRTKIIEKGTNPALLDRLTGYATLVNEANVAQESLKESSKELTSEALDNFNDIYKDVIGICKIASGYYQYEPLKKEQFTFSKVLENLGASRNAPGNQAA